MIFDHNHLLFLSVFLFGYFMGSIPFGLLLSKLSGLGDIRKIGSGNTVSYTHLTLPTTPRV